MNVNIKPMGDYQTNCYIVSIDDKDIIIDPGVGATAWIEKNVKNPIAILNTHGHFDHVWSNKEVSEKLDLKIYTPKDDNVMLQKDPYGLGMTPSSADYLIEPDEEIELEGIKIKFHHFPGHTPGCSAIQIDKYLFTGDFIFKGSIGRCDFPMSNPQHMKESIKKILQWNDNYKIFPGHGETTTLLQEKDSLVQWLNYL